MLEINKELIIIIPKQSKDKMNKERVMAVKLQLRGHHCNCYFLRGLFLIILRKTTTCTYFEVNWFFVDFKLIPTQVMSWSSTNHSVNQTCFVEDIFKFWVFFLAKTPVTRFAIINYAEIMLILTSSCQTVCQSY
jgi:hypothetical protein